MKAIAVQVAPYCEDNQHIGVALKILPHGMDLPPPSYATAGAAGCDLVAAVERSVTLQPGQRQLIPTGIAMALPPGFEAQIRPRSGLALKQGITVLNTPGTIDADYRGEIGIILINLGQEPVTIDRGMRIAQMVIARHETARFDIMQTLPETDRGTGGFGSTGTGFNP